MRRITALILGMMALATPHGSFAQLAEKKVLTLEATENIAVAAQTEAMKRNATVVIAVVDDAGYPLIVKRLNDTQVASVEVGIGKARTAAIFRRPSAVSEEQIKNGRVASLVLPGATPLQGGLPLIHESKTVGAIGVSGNTPQEDEDIAKAGVLAFAAGQPSSKPIGANVTYLPAAQVSKAFEKGMPLIEVANYKIHASHRDEPGMAEIHEKDTDIIYVLEGAATFVTGGRATESKQTDVEEIRGKAIEGGKTHRLVKGDVIVVPHGTPHWFKAVSSPFNYYVVKVRAAN